MLFLQSLMADFAGLITFGACAIFTFYTCMAALALLATFLSDRLTPRDKVLYALGLGIVIGWGGFLINLSWNLGVWLLTS